MMQLRNPVLQAGAFIRCLVYVWVLSSVRGIGSYIGIGLHDGWRWTLDWLGTGSTRWYWMIPVMID
jgi:hypothetical protein